MKQHLPIVDELPTIDPNLLETRDEEETNQFSRNRINLEQYFIAHKYSITVRFDAHAPHGLMKEFLKKFKSLTWVYSREREPKDHTHMVILSNTKIPTATTINRWITNMFGCTGSQKSTSQIRTSVNKAIAYICKEGDVSYNGFPKNLMQGLISQSTTKFNKEKIGNELFDLETRYYSGEISDHNFANAFSDLRAKYGQSHGRTGIFNYLSKHFYRKNVEERHTYYSSIMDDIANVDRF